MSDLSLSNHELDLLEGVLDATWVFEEQRYSALVALEKKHPSLLILTAATAADRPRGVLGHAVATPMGGNLVQAYLIGKVSAFAEVNAAIRGDQNVREVVMAFRGEVAG